jgi:hypothetical protein
MLTQDIQVLNHPLRHLGAAVKQLLHLSIHTVTVGKMQGRQLEAQEEGGIR